MRNGRELWRWKGRGKGNCEGWKKDGRVDMWKTMQQRGNAKRGEERMEVSKERKKIDKRKKEREEKWPLKYTTIENTHKQKRWEEEIETGLHEKDLAIVKDGFQRFHNQTRSFLSWCFIVDLNGRYSSFLSIELREYLAKMRSTILCIDETLFTWKRMVEHFESENGCNPSLWI